jgi:hypothetical protein
MEKMRVDLRGLSLAEAEAEVSAMIDEAQAAALQDYLLAMIDLGRTDDLNRQLACRRAELEVIRERILVKFRAFVSRGGQPLH